MLRRSVLGFVSDRGGGVALIAALSLPAITVIALGAVQLQAVFSDRALTQDVADAAALWGASQLTVTKEGATERTNAYAEAMLTKVSATSTVRVSTELVGTKSVKVVVDTNRPSFFLNLFPRGGFNTHSESIAENIGTMPLCVLVFGSTSADSAEVTGRSKVTAPACLVHANQRVEVAAAATLQAGVIQVVMGASGPMTPTASNGALAVKDPFETIDLDSPLVCASTPAKKTYSSNATLAAGVHCNDIEVKNGATLTLASGDHYFARVLELKDTSKLVGDDVALVFGKNAVPKFPTHASSGGDDDEGDDDEGGDDEGDDDEEEGGAGGWSVIRLTGRKSGALAGFVIATTRSRTAELQLNSDAVEELTGTVYVPSARLSIEGDSLAAEASDWTVMAVKSLKLLNKPQVKINADYTGSDVPVPNGVGTSGSAGTRLTR